MNKVILVGNLTRDPEMRSTSQGTSVTTFTVACSRRFKDADGSYQADFINCVAWRQAAEFIARYFSKGSRIGLSGSLQSRSYDDKNGNKRYVTEVNVDEVEFVDSKPEPKEVKPKEDDLEEFVPIDDTDLPF